MRSRLLLTFGLALSFYSFQACSAGSDMDVTASTQLRLLELKYFEHTFDDEPTEERVERVENLVCGAVGEGSPQDRVKKLAAALQADGESLSPAKADDDASATSKAKTKTPVADKSNSGEGSDAGASDTGEYPKVTNLEKEILKQTFLGQALATRLSRLETKAFGSPSKSSDLGDRTDRLEAYAEQTLHDKPFGVNADIDKPYVLSQAPQQNAQPGAQQALEHFFNTTRRLNDEFSGRSMAPSGTFGQSSEAGTSAQPEDDPAAYDKNPPPPNARMLTHVAWCEVQMFGHTFPNMHLTKRLRQLSDATIPKISKQSDLQLMDDLDPIEKAVIARKAGKQSISSGKAPV